MNFKQRFPIIDAHGYLERAYYWLESESDIAVFYAALELRFTFEKILIKHGWASNNNTNNFEKKHSKAEILGETLTSEFSQKIALDKAYKFFFPPGKDYEEIVFGYYLPINQDLYTSYGKLDNLLHAQWAIPIGLPNRKWQKERKKDLLIFADKLIPHANPKNSLDLISLPNIKYEEMDNQVIEQQLSGYWDK
jgi:hypothetical protein